MIQPLFWVSCRETGSKFPEWKFNCLALDTGNGAIYKAMRLQGRLFNRLCWTTGITEYPIPRQRRNSAWDGA